MTRDRSGFILQVPAARAAAVLPRELGVDRATLILSPEQATSTVLHGRLQRFAADWTRGPARGWSHVEVRPTSKLTTEITVELEQPKGLRGLFWTRQGLRRLATLFARALRYEIETRAQDGADAFDVRRTSEALVRARTA